MSVRVGIGHPVTRGLLSPWAQNVVAVPFAGPGGATVESIHQADEDWGRESLTSRPVRIRTFSPPSM